MLVFQPTAITNDHRSMIGNVVPRWKVGQEDIPFTQLTRRANTAARSHTVRETILSDETGAVLMERLRQAAASMRPCLREVDELMRTRTHAHCHEQERRGVDRDRRVGYDSEFRSSLSTVTMPTECNEGKHYACPLACTALSYSPPHNRRH